MKCFHSSELNLFTYLLLLLLIINIGEHLFTFISRSRGVATGITAAGCYVMAFIASKTYYNLESFLSLPGVSMMYASIGVVGFIVAYFIIPETENRTLEDIEIHFSDNSRNLTDRKIEKNAVGKELKMASIDNDKLNVATSTEKQPSVVVNMILNDRRSAETGKVGGICNEAFMPDN